MPGINARSYVSSFVRVSIYIHTLCTHAAKLVLAGLPDPPSLDGATSGKMSRPAHLYSDILKFHVLFDMSYIYKQCVLSSINPGLSHLRGLQITIDKNKG